MALSESIPDTLLQTLYDLQEFMDERTQLGQIQEGVYKDFCDKMGGGGEGWFGDFQDIIAKLRILSGEVKAVRKRKNELAERTARITHEQALSRALNCEDDTYLPCPRCSRPIAKSGLKAHQRTAACQTIWKGRDSVELNGNARDARKHAVYIVHTHDAYGPEYESEEDEVFVDVA